MFRFKTITNAAAKARRGRAVMVLGPVQSPGLGLAADRIAELGVTIEHEAEMFTALSAMIDDPAGYGLFVMACDSYGGLAAGRTACAMLGSLTTRIPVILITGETGEKVIPELGQDPIVLPAPLSTGALEQALSGCRWIAA
ncbi:MAG: hypothetical protein GW948_00445 [Rhodobacterales bacterium]|nr:hypothetical protein [Rhodobacterales bacterium]NCO17009.1 hypothetical protein [Alphaproteobacteria bacterium]